MSKALGQKSCNLIRLLQLPGARAVGRDVLRAGLMHLDAGTREPGPRHLSVATQIILERIQEDAPRGSRGCTG